MSSWTGMFLNVCQKAFFYWRLSHEIWIDYNLWHVTLQHCGFKRPEEYKYSYIIFCHLSLQTLKKGRNYTLKIIILSNTVMMMIKGQLCAGNTKAAYVHFVYCFAINVISYAYQKHISLPLPAVLRLHFFLREDYAFLVFK